MDLNCVCGHESSVHDDEPAGCWLCDCEGWTEEEPPKELDSDPGLT